MKYWQEERWQTATKTNVPHLYLYTWIRVGLWFALIINSILMFFISKKNSVLDEMIPREDRFFIFIALVGLISVSLPFDSRKTRRTLYNVVCDIIQVGAVSILYMYGNFNVVFIYLLELIAITYLGVKIDKDNSLVDNNKFVLWWKHKEQEKSDRKLKKLIEKHSGTTIERTEEQKLKTMSRKQRKTYKQKKNNRRKP